MDFFEWNEKYFLIIFNALKSTFEIVSISTKSDDLILENTQKIDKLKNN